MTYLLSPLVVSQSPAATPVLRCAPRTQEEKLPLHYAAAQGAPLDVMKLLLDANRDAATAVAQARRGAHVPAPTMLLDAAAAQHTA